MNSLTFQDSNLGPSVYMTEGPSTELTKCSWMVKSAVDFNK